ncbi:MAG: pilus assembly protein PilP [Byssovorax sp.]
MNPTKRSKTSSPFTVVAAALSLVTAVALLNGCGDDDVVEGGPAGSGKPAAAAPAKPGAAPGAVAGADAGADAGYDPASNLPPLPLREFQERDFDETDQSRDPFRSFAGVFAAQAKTKIVIQRKVLVEQYALEELRLAGIVNRGVSRALLTDPKGLGWVAKVGDFVGKAELVHAGGPTGADVAVNWRVDRIREADVVFVREDPSHPEIPPTTRVVALRSPDEDIAQKSRVQ